MLIFKIRLYGPLQAKKCLRIFAKCAFRSSCVCAKYHPDLCSPFIHSVVYNKSVSVRANLGLRYQHITWRHIFAYGPSHSLCIYIYISERQTTRNIENVTRLRCFLFMPFWAKIKKNVFFCLFVFFRYAQNAPENQSPSQEDHLRRLACLIINEVMIFDFRILSYSGNESDHMSACMFAQSDQGLS